MPTDSQRTFGLHIYSPRGQDYRIEIERETIRAYENGDVLRIASSRVLCQFSSLAAGELPGPIQLVDAGGQARRATYADLQAIISACADALAAADEAAKAAAAVALAERRAAEAAAAALGKVAPPLSAPLPIL